MNTITEVQPNGDLNGNNSNETANNVTSTSSSSSTNGGLQNGNSSNISINGGTRSSPEDYRNYLKIIGQLKNIEKVNENRRIFLTNTISEYSTDETTETKTLNGAKVSNGNGTNSDVVHHFNETRTHIREKHVDSSSDIDNMSLGTSKFVTPLKSPMTPPPKPPMLSRVNSFGVADNRSATLPAYLPTSAVENPAQTNFQSNVPRSDGTSNNIITTATITTAVVAEPIKVTTIQLQEDTPVLRRVECSMSETPESSKQISAKHYERLIEELKCPGCAYPMKAPILLCQTGHSICQQCTRVLMLCPLCKEPFTKMRSLTVEALCSKAHFRCHNASGGCTVRLQIDLLNWHEQQCIYKPMKCFMGRVWGECKWTGREAFWKEHLETEHADKVFTTDSKELIWNMGVQQKALTGYYVFEVFDEMFNFYEVYDKERVLFTMTCTSTVKEKKLNYAYEVTMINQDNEALAITQKFPVHSEYDKDILLEGTCVSIPLGDLAKFIDEDKLLHYRVRVLQVKSPRKSKLMQRNANSPNGMHPIDFQQTQIEGVNLKNVPTDVIVTRKLDDAGSYYDGTVSTPSSIAPISSSEDELDKIRRQYNEAQSAAHKNNDSGSESDPEFEAFIAKKWGTPQLHFNRKFLKTTSSDSSSNEDGTKDRSSKNGDVLGNMDKKFQNDDKISICSTNTSYKKRMSNTLRKSFRSFKTDLIEMRPFTKKSPEKNGGEKQPK